MTVTFIRKPFEYTHTQRLCEDRGRVGVKRLQGREGQTLKATTRSYERGLELTPSVPSERISPANTTVSDSWPPELWENKFLLSEGISFWYFMMEAPGNSYNYQQSSDIIWPIFLIHEVWVHIICIVLHAYWYWLHTWKTSLLKGHKVLIWVLNFLSF